MKRVLSCIYILFIVGVFALPQVVSNESQTPIQNSGANKKIDQVEHYSSAEILQKIQEARVKIGLNELIVGDQICQEASPIFSKYVQGATLETNDLDDFCASCKQKAYVSISGNWVNRDDPWIEKSELTSMAGQEYSHVCVFQENENALILFGQISREKNTRGTSQDLQVSRNFSENELWQALVDYRHAHTKPDLLQSESLCVYARKRVLEHIEKKKTTSLTEYKNPDKYPLDAHEGFERDGQSGEVFEITGFTTVAENLAYWPSAMYPNQVIEWGWDTSTEGHREAQLSTEYSHACLSGLDGFYVSIFARN